MNSEEQGRLGFIYASAMAEVALAPVSPLETFGTTVINYRLVSPLEGEDAGGRVRVREGRLVAGRPELITPSRLAELEAEGFSEEARRYLEHLREHEDRVRVLQYGYRLSRESFSEQVVSGPVEAVVEQAVADAKGSGDPFAAVVQGVDDPWDVALVKLFWVTINASAPVNIRQLEAARRRAGAESVPKSLREEVERSFARAEADPSLTRELAAFLRRKGVFEQYQDRFFKLVRQ